MDGEQATERSSPVFYKSPDFASPPSRDSSWSGNTAKACHTHTGVCVRENKTVSEPVLFLWIYYFYEYKRTLCIHFFRIFHSKSLQ